MIQIMSIYSAYLLNKEDFFTRFIKFMAFMPEYHWYVLHCK